MLTRAGSLTCLVSLVSGVTALLFGLPELFLAALVTAGLAAAAVVTVRRRPRLGVTCRPAVGRITCGTPLTVHLEILNRARRRRSAAAGISDEATASPSPVVALGPIAAGQSLEVTYRLDCGQRGWRPVGPLQLERTDPFGLARRSHPAAQGRRVLVRPRITALGPLPQHFFGEHSRASRVAGQAETSFHSLRQYQPGDDARRIHWPSSARHRELLVRRTEAPRHYETVIYLETDEAAAGPERFERMVSVAAGLAAAAAENFGTIRLYTRAGQLAAAMGSPEELFDALALVGRSAPAGSPAPPPPVTHRAGLLAVIGDATPAEVAGLVETTGPRIVVQFWEHRPPLAHRGVVPVGPHESPVARWRTHWAAEPALGGAAGRPAGATR